MISLNNLSKSFDSNLVINNLSFSFPSTGLFHIQGINGCGKSTLLRIIAGLDLDYDGDVIYNSQKITAENAASYVGYKAALLFDTPIILSEMSVIDNILYPFNSKDEDRALECLKIVGLEDFKFSEASTLSQGEKQRLSFARMLFLKPEIILLDEIFHNLDEENRNILVNAILELSKDHLIIFTSHLETEAKLDENSSILEMEDGTLKEVVLKEFNNSATPSELKEGKLSSLIKREFKGHKRIYVTLSLMMTFFTFIMLSFSSLISFPTDPEFNRNATCESYIKNSSGYMIKEEYEQEFDDEYIFYSYDYNSPTYIPFSLSFRPSTVGSKGTGICTPKVSFEDSIIKIAERNGKVYGRYPEKSNEVLISFFSYDYAITNFQKNANISSYQEAEERFFEENLFSFDPCLDLNQKVKVVGFYEPFGTNKERVGYNYAYQKRDLTNISYYLGLETIFVTSDTIMNMKYDSHILVLRTQETQNIIQQNMLAENSIYNSLEDIDIINITEYNDIQFIYEDAYLIYYINLLKSFVFVPVVIAVFIFLILICIMMSYFLTEKKRLILERGLGISYRTQRKRFLITYLISVLSSLSLGCLLSVIFSISLNAYFSSKTIGAAVNLFPFSYFYLLIELLICILSIIVLLIFFKFYLSKDISNKLEEITSK